MTDEGAQEIRKELRPRFAAVRLAQHSGLGSTVFALQLRDVLTRRQKEN